MLGDIVGRSGRKIIHDLLKEIKDEYKADFIIANGENGAGGNGLTPKIAEELFESGINVLTSGNHIWDKKEIIEFIDEEKRLIRPANYPPGTPGSGWTVLEVNKECKVGVINISGRVFLDALDCPFRAIDEILPKIKSYTPVIIIDFHAEATSEKEAFGWYVDGLASAVCGTHTHVQTSDARVLPQGTGYITDVGMSGARDGILGIQREPVIQKFITQMPVRFEVASGVLQIEGVYLEVDESKGQCLQIESFRREKKGL